MEGRVDTVYAIPRECLWKVADLALDGLNHFEIRVSEVAFCLRFWDQGTDK